MNRRLVVRLGTLLILVVLIHSPFGIQAQTVDQDVYKSSNVGFVTNFQDDVLVDPLVDPVDRYRRDAWGDAAFWGTTAVLFDGQGDKTSGFRVYDITDPAQPRLLSRENREGGTNHVAIWQDLVIISTEHGKEPCLDDPKELCDFQGLVIYSIANRHAPQKLAALPVPCSGHTFTLLPDLRRGRLLAYLNANYCPERTPSIPLIEIPLANPANLGEIQRIQLDEPFQLNHDMTIFMPLQLAVVLDPAYGFLIWDISDPENPRTLKRVLTPDVLTNSNHSAAFSWDGRYLVIGEEFLGASTDLPVGRLRFYDVEQILKGDGMTTIHKPIATYMIRGERGGLLSPFSAHQFNVLPLKLQNGKMRHVLSASWYRGGVTIVDFTNPKNPTEIGHYVFKGSPHSNTYSAFWYNGYVYALNSPEDGLLYLQRSRGVDILKIYDPETGQDFASQAFKLPRLNYSLQEGLPGLRVIKVRKTEEADSSQQPMLSATLMNESFAIAGATKTKFLLDDTIVLGEIGTPAIPPGESVTVSIAWSLPEDNEEHTLRVIVDSTGALDLLGQVDSAASPTVTIIGEQIIEGDLVSP